MKRTVLVLLLALAVVAPSWAQPSGPGDYHHRIMQLFGRIAGHDGMRPEPGMGPRGPRGQHGPGFMPPGPRSRTKAGAPGVLGFFAKLDKLGISDEQVLKLRHIFSKRQGEIKNAKAQLKECRQERSGLMKDPAKLTEQAIRKMVDAQMAARKQMVLARLLMMKEMFDVLTEAQRKALFAKKPRQGIGPRGRMPMWGPRGRGRGMPGFRPQMPPMMPPPGARPPAPPVTEKE